MMKTWGIQPIIQSAALLCVQSTLDLLKYLDAEIVVEGDLAFLVREEPNDTKEIRSDRRAEQFWHNGLLFSGLVEHLNDEEFEQVEGDFENLVSLVSSILSKKLNAMGLESTHHVIVHRDEKYGDVVVSFLAH